MDSYPQNFDCSNPDAWKPVVTNYYSYHECTSFSCHIFFLMLSQHSAVNPSQPWYFPEFQGGAFDAWGPTAPGKTLTSVGFIFL
jgi:hypothetical protein